MMSNGKVKFYKNPERNNIVAHKSYVPQYQVLGLEPEEHKNSLVTLVKPPPLPNNNPRAPKSVIRQPYAETVESPIGRGRGPVPNVGNNMEHTWSSVDGEIVDDLTDELDPNHPMLDNNEFVSMEALGVSEDAEIQNEESPSKIKKFLTQTELQKVIMSDSEKVSGLLSLSEDEYLLLIDGIEVCSGSLEDVQDEVKGLVFGEHEICDGNPVSIDDIIVIKRIKIKVGVFLE